MTDRVSPDQLSALLHERLEVGLGPRSGVPTPATGFSSPSPHGGGTEQGTFSGSSGGVGRVGGFVSDLSSVFVSAVSSKNEIASPSVNIKDRPIDLKDAFAPVRLLLGDPLFLRTCCFGTVGKSGKFCTRLRDGSGDTTCGTRSHVKKAIVQEGYIYFWDEPMNIGYLTPTLDSRVKLADAI